ncbi:MAG TPA: RNA polymerase-binding protein DksA [Nevskiaceae bacterium]|nr:RNA polymerase-binding protein DksA [Nevskiaceae bacterium]
MKSKKPAARPAAKAANAKSKKPAAKHVPKAKPLAAKKPAKASKPAAAPKKHSAVKAAASKLRGLFTKPASNKKSPDQPASVVSNRTPARPTAPSKMQTATKPFQSKLVPPKGLLSEAQIRRMSDKDYMNDSQLEFFRHRLFQMREEVLAREVDVKERLHQREVFADPADRATAEEEHWLDLRLRERESLLLRKIDEALRRIAEKEFGYCEKTGDPIGIPRLLARPTATVCVDVKGQDERVEAQFRDR